MIRARILATPIRRDIVIAGLLGAAVLAALPNDSGASAVASGPAYVDPRGVLDARSPGARPHGALFQTKPGLPHDRALPAVPAAAPPTQRVLSSVRDRPMVIPVNDTLPTLAVPFDPVPIAAAAQPLGALDPFLDPVIPSFFAEPFAPLTPGRPGVNPPAAVPEPESWLLLIGGHAVLGWSLRRRRRLRTAH